MTLQGAHWVRPTSIFGLLATDEVQMQVRALTRLSGSRVCLKNRVPFLLPLPNPIVACRNGTGSPITSPRKVHLGAYRRVRVSQSASSSRYSTSDTLQNGETSSEALVVDEEKWYTRRKASALLLKAWCASSVIPKLALSNSFDYTAKWCLMNNWKLQLSISGSSNQARVVIHWSGENATHFEVRGVAENPVRSVWSLNHGRSVDIWQESALNTASKVLLVRLLAIGHSPLAGVAQLLTPAQQFDKDTGILDSSFYRENLLVSKLPFFAIKKSANYLSLSVRSRTSHLLLESTCAHPDQVFESIKTLARRYKDEANVSSTTTVSAIDSRPSITFIPDSIEAEARAKGMASALGISGLGLTTYRCSLDQDQQCLILWYSAKVRVGKTELSKIETSWFTSLVACVLAWNLAASDLQERLGSDRRVIKKDGEWTVVDVDAQISAVEEGAASPTDTAALSTTELRTTDGDTPSDDVPEQSGPTPDSRRESGTSVSETTKSSVNATRLSPVSISVSESVLAASLQTIKDVRKAGLPDVVPPPAAYEAPYRLRDLHLFRQHAAYEPHTISMRSFRTEHVRDSGQESFRSENSPVYESRNRDRILHLVGDNDVTIITGFPGCGMTTQIPQLLSEQVVDSDAVAPHNILCTQSEQLATILAAHKVASDRREPLQKSVGYFTRLESRPPQPGSSISFSTTDRMLEMLQTNPDQVLGTYRDIILDQLQEDNLMDRAVVQILHRTLDTRRSQRLHVPKIVATMGRTEPQALIGNFKQSGLHWLALSLASLDIDGEASPVQSHFLEDIVTSLRQSYDKAHLMEVLEPLKLQTNDSSMTRRFLQAEAEYVMHRESVPASGRLEQCPLGLIVAIVAHLVATTTCGRILVLFPSEATIHSTWRLLLQTRPLGINLADSSKIKITQVCHDSPDLPEDHSLTSSTTQHEVLLATDASAYSMRLFDIHYVVDSGRRKAPTDPTGPSNSEEVMISAANSSLRRDLVAHRDGGQYYTCFSKERHGTLLPLTNPVPGESQLLNLCATIPLSVNPVETDLKIMITLGAAESVAVTDRLQSLQYRGLLTAQGSVTALGRVLSSLQITLSRAKALLIAV